jgi:hypothetical protein
VKTILIIYPHWVPANLAGVHRPRLIANYLKEFNWHPILLTVDSQYYEEPLDSTFNQTASKNIEVIYTKAYKTGRPRIIGDIGLRAFPFLYKKALQICNERDISFIWIPIPSFYTALLGRVLHGKTNIAYGIDYIDPWVRDLTNQSNWRAKISQFVARFLEPIAIKKAALISGVSENYYLPALHRNFKTFPEHVGMPYGFDPNDHRIQLKEIKYPWDSIKNCKPWLYAGAFLPNSHVFIQALFSCIQKLRNENNWDENIHLFFIGTGPYPAKQISSYAEEFGLTDIVTENRNRFPFLQVLNFLSEADKVLLIGSTEMHYTASKTFQCLLSRRPVFAMLHKESSATAIFKEAEANRYLFEYQDKMQLPDILDGISPLLTAFQNEESWDLNESTLSPYSSRESACKLVEKINIISR